MTVRGIPDGYGIIVTKSGLDTFLASFPGLPHFQFLIPIDCTMQNCCILQAIYIYINWKWGSPWSKVSLLSLHS